jgi:large subunit ribosomal protein L6
MRKEIQESVSIPEGISCKLEKSKIICSKGSNSLEREFLDVGTELKVEGSDLKIVCLKSNKNNLKKIRTLLAHLKNMFEGLNEKFVYKLEAANVYFPMTLKKEGDYLIVTNFLGEKTPRKSLILKGVNVEIKGKEIFVTSHDKELAGQTAANIERATKVRNRDRRVFQDGIFIVSKPGDEK